MPDNLRLLLLKNRYNIIGSLIVTLGYRQDIVKMSINCRCVVIVPKIGPLSCTAMTKQYFTTISFHFYSLHENNEENQVKPICGSRTYLSTSFK